ncbi:MAG: SAM-dependent methyltransferase [Ideonella sp. MAG2]|nr:MAG: SAM-dependent methyltransferase [Ideonella sp. MAG2]
MNPSTDLPFSPAADRNKQPILERLQALLPPRAQVLEVASGTGQHAAHFAAAQPGWQWQPTDYAAEALPTIAARCAPWPQVRPPVRLDVTQHPWPFETGQFDAIYAANMLHIAPREACKGLMNGAAIHLRPDGWLLLYGPYIVEGEPTAPSNLAFDADLRARNPLWGLRELGTVCAEAQAAGLHLQARHAMPANNFLLVFGRSAGRQPS